MPLPSWKETQGWKEAVRRACVVLAGLILLLFSLQFLLTPVPPHNVSGGISPVMGTSVLKFVLVKALGALGTALAFWLLYLGILATDEMKLRRMERGLALTGKSLLIAGVPALAVIIFILHDFQVLNIVRSIAGTDSG